MTVHQEVKIGVPPLEIHPRGGVGDRVVMTQGKPARGKRIAPVARLAKALGIRATDITATKLLPQVASTGVRSLQVPIRSMKTVRAMEPDMPALANVLRRVDPEAGAYAVPFQAEGGAGLPARGVFPAFRVPGDPAP